MYYLYRETGNGTVILTFASSYREGVYAVARKYRKKGYKTFINRTLI